MAKNTLDESFWLKQQKIIDDLNNSLDYVILCPSRSRAKNVTTISFIPDLVLVVGESQYHEYAENNPNTVVLATPSKIKGITPTRQWMLDNFKNIFMIDDDVCRVARNYIGANDELEYNITCTETIREIIDYSFRMAKLIGAKKFGFPSTRNPLEYSGHKPFTYTGYYNNSHVGFLEGHGLRYSEEYGEAEDYYLSLQHALKNRYGFFDKRFTFITKDNFVGNGGCCEYRTIEMMKTNTLRLRENFGETVLIKRVSNTKAKVHEGERSISIPF